MTEFLRWLEDSQFSSWVRESPSPFAFPTVLLLHTIGMGLCVGINAGINLRILGFAPSIKLAPLAKFFPVFWLGFIMNAVTGTILVAQDARTKLTLKNPDFILKMIFIAFALFTLRKLQQRVFGDPNLDQVPFTSQAKMLAVLSLFFWIGAITAGRLLAYVSPMVGLG